MNLARRWAMGTPRRLMPTSPRSSEPPFFSTIAWARRTSVRPISEADMSCAFWRKPEDLGAVFLVGMTGLHHTRPGGDRARKLTSFADEIERLVGGHEFRAKRFEFRMGFPAFFRIEGLDRVVDHRNGAPAFEQSHGGET